MSFPYNYRGASRSVTSAFSGSKGKITCKRAGDHSQPRRATVHPQLSYSVVREFFTMFSLNRPSKALFLLAIGLCSFAVAHAQCKLPPQLDAKLRAHPTIDTAIDAGSWFGSHQQFDCAVDIFRVALKADPKSAQLYYLEGLALVGGKHPDQAIEAVKQSTQLDPKVIKPHLLLADLYRQAGHAEEAEEQWKQALGIDPHSEAALEGLSNALLDRKDYISVIGLLQHAPRTEPLALALSKALGLLNYYEAAGDVLNEAIRLNPKSAALANAESVVLVKQHKYEDAIKLLQNAAQQHPGDQQIEIQLLRVMVLTDHINLARPIAPKLLALHPHDAEVLYLNGFVEHAMGNDTQAKAHLEEAVERDPDFFSYHYKLGMVLVTLHENQEAKEQLEKAVALGDTEPNVHYQLALALRGLGDKEHATEEVSLYQKLKQAEDDASAAALKVKQADGELDEGKVQDAIVLYRDICEAMPENANYKFKLAIALHRAGDTEGERAQLEAAIKLDPQIAGAQKQLGYLLARSGDAAGAVEHFKLAVQDAPAWTDAWISLSAEFAVLRDFDDARKAAAMALRLDPANDQARKLSERLASDPAAQQSQP
jgi:tetratricopeptide (TPR) repeat protein